MILSKRQMTKALICAFVVRKPRRQVSPHRGPRNKYQNMICWLIHDIYNVDVRCIYSLICILGNFSCFCCLLLIFFKINIFNKKIRNTSCLQRLSADDKSHHQRGESMQFSYINSLLARVFSVC